MLNSTVLSLLLAGSVHVDVMTPEKRPLRDRTAILKLEARRVTTVHSQDDARAIPVVQGQADTSLPAGEWMFTVASPRYWSKGVKIVVGDAPSSIALTVWPGGTIRGRFASGSETPIPTAVTISFKPPGEREPSPAGTSECPVNKGQWQCSAPATALDVQVRIGDSIPGYFWDVTVPVGGIADLEAFRLRHGTSIIGWVRHSDGTAASGIPVTVSALPAEQRLPDSPADAPPEQAAAARTNARGFFQVFDAEPGERRIVAAAGGLLDAGVTTRIRPNTENLVAVPLILKQAVTLTIRITPPLDSNSEPWGFNLYRSDPVQVLQKNREVPETGELRDITVPRGRYRMEVTSRENRAVWYRETVEVESSRPIDIKLPVMLVEGTVTLGGKPIAAQVVFGGSYDHLKIQFESDSEGHFQGAIRGDHAPEWEVDVASETPFVRRTLRNVKITPPADGSVARVDLTLPATVLFGVVRWEEGEPKPRGIVVTAYGLNSETSDGVQTRTGDGTFRFEGLPAGEYRVSAEARGATGLLNSDERSTVIGDEIGGSVDLLLRRGRQFVGRLATSDGDPIPDGSVVVMPADNPLAGGQTSRSDVDGMFSQTLQPGTKAVHMSVSALGYAFRMMIAPLSDGSDPVAVVLSREGGTIAVDFSPGGSARPWEGAPFLLHAGSFQAVSLFDQWARSHGGEWRLQEGHVVIPAMAAGTYVACIPSSSHQIEAIAFGRLDGLSCVRGDLRANATLKLRVPSPSQKASVAR